MAFARARGAPHPPKAQLGAAGRRRRVPSYIRAPPHTHVHPPTTAAAPLPPKPPTQPTSRLHVRSPLLLHRSDSSDERPPTFRSASPCIPSRLLHPPFPTGVFPLWSPPPLPIAPPTHPTTAHPLSSVGPLLLTSNKRRLSGPAPRRQRLLGAWRARLLTPSPTPHPFRPAPAPSQNLPRY